MERAHDLLTETSFKGPLFHLLFPRSLFRLSFVSLNHYLFHPNSQRKEIKQSLNEGLKPSYWETRHPSLNGNHLLLLKLWWALERSESQSTADIQDRPSTQKAFPRRQPPPHSSASVPLSRHSEDRNQ